MKEMNLEEFRKFAKENDVNITKLNGESMNSENFLIGCKKCGSFDIDVRTEFHYSMGFEWTGVYDESVDLLFKCNACGAAEEFE